MSATEKKDLFDEFDSEDEELEDGLDDDEDEGEAPAPQKSEKVFLPLEERQTVKIRKSRIEIGANIAVSYVVPAAIKMEGRQVSRVIEPDGDSVIEYTDRDEAEAAVLNAGFRPVY